MILQVGSYYSLDCIRSFCLVEAVIILVHVSIKDDYEPHHDAFAAIIEIFITLTEGSEKKYPIIWKPVPTMKPSCKPYQVQVDKECLLKIILPETQPETFKKQRAAIWKGLKALTNVDMKKVEVIRSCCHVILTLTATGFIRLVCCLLSPESLWQLLSSVDELVEIQLGNLLPVKLSKIFKKFAHPRAVSRDLGNLATVKHGRATRGQFCEFSRTFYSAENQNNM